jgi:uncharacterized protein (TIGR02646 family)
MIRINKPKRPPDVLITKGANQRRTLCALYSRYSRDYDSGVKTFHSHFDREIYAHETVKRALIESQHGKCCFCEARITHIVEGDVEHFRPKAGYRQNPNDELQRPGYYWLVYEWGNLLLSCPKCNRRFKGNLFPLLDPSKRARSHRADIKSEQPLFINPAEDDPQGFISFKRDRLFALDGNARGEATIKMLGLDRMELNQERRDYYEKLRLIYSLAFADPPHPSSDEAKALLEKSMRESEPYAAMARAAIASQFSPDA